MSIYQKIAENLQFVSPSLYKKRFFKKLDHLSWDNITVRNIEPELLWITSFLDKNSVVLEVGANVGSYLYQIEKKVPQSQIFAFEPNQELFDRLKRLFPSINLYPYAISDENTVANFKIPVINGKKIASRGTLKTDFTEVDEEQQITQKVQVIRLDDWEEMASFKRIDFVKIDVEGNEMQTLRGAEKTLKKFRPILLVEMEQRHHHEAIWKFISEIEGWNYEAHFLDRETFSLKKLTQSIITLQNQELLKDKKNYINNVIFIPQK